MFLPLFWIVFGIWFYNTAKRVNAKPLRWLLIAVLSSTALVLMFTSLMQFLPPEPETISPDYKSLSEHRDNIRAGFILLNIGGSAGLMVALHRYLVKTVPYRNTEPSDPAQKL